MTAGGWRHVYMVTMYVAKCSICRERVSAAPRETPADAHADLVAHYHIVHEMEMPA